MNAPETMPWGALILALWPLWLIYGTLAVLRLSEALRGRQEALR